jgi:hypothetical protein
MSNMLHHGYRAGIICDAQYASYGVCLLGLHQQPCGRPGLVGCEFLIAFFTRFRHSAPDDRFVEKKATSAGFRLSAFYL